jgi:hypothetical protein
MTPVLSFKSIIYLSFIKTRFDINWSHNDKFHFTLNKLPNKAKSNNSQKSGQKCLSNKFHKLQHFDEKNILKF